MRQVEVTSVDGADLEWPCGLVMGPAAGEGSDRPRSHVTDAVVVQAETVLRFRLDEPERLREAERAASRDHHRQRRPQDLDVNRNPAAEVDATCCRTHLRMLTRTSL